MRSVNRSTASHTTTSSGEIERSLASRHLGARIQAAARTTLAILIEGETGTGKERVARRIHALGPEAEALFVVVHCASLPESLLEGELFGYGRGSASERERAGLLESAGTGTVFLDEVGDLPVTVQTRLSRAIERSEVMRLGDASARPIRARIVASTNRNLRAEMRSGKLRPDFYFRIAAFPIRVPSLRERREDLPELIETLALEAQQRLGRRRTGIDPDATARLVDAPWPGNLRQLENALIRAAALANDGTPISLEEFDPESLEAEPEAEDLMAGAAGASGLVRPHSRIVASATARKPLRAARAEFEAAYIAESLAEQRGNVSRTARLLGVSRVALHKKIVAYGLR